MAASHDPLLYSARHEAAASKFRRPTSIAGLHGDAEAAVAEIFLRRRGLAAVRADHRAARILSDAHRARDSAASMRGDDAALHSRRAALVEFGSGSSTKTRSCSMRRRSSRPTCRSTSRPSSCEQEAAGAAPRIPGSRCCRSRPTSPRLRPAAADPRCPRVGFFPGSTIGNFEPHEAAAFLRHAGRILGPRRDFIVGVDLRQGHGGAQRRLQRRRGRHRAVQSQSAGAHQPRARRQVRSRALPSITRSTTRAPPHRDASGKPASARASRSRGATFDSARARRSTPRTPTSTRSSPSARWRAAPAGAGCGMDRREQLFRGACAEALSVHPPRPRRARAGP